MIAYIAKEDHLESPFVGYFGSKIEAIKALREYKKARFGNEQEEAETRLDATEDYDADDCIIEMIESKIGGRPNKVYDHEIEKITIGNKSDLIESLNDAIEIGVNYAGGEQ